MKEKVQKNASSNPIYGLGIIGALIYYISSATSFWVGALGVLKAIGYTHYKKREHSLFIAVHIHKI